MNRVLVVGTTHNLQKYETHVVFNGPSNCTMTLPSSPRIGQTYFIANQSSGLNLYITQYNQYSATIYRAGGNYITLTVPDRHSVMLFYTGYNWAAIMD